MFHEEAPFQDERYHEDFFYYITVHRKRLDWYAPCLFEIRGDEKTAWRLHSQILCDMIDQT